MRWKRRRELQGPSSFLGSAARHPCATYDWLRVLHEDNNGSHCWLLFTGTLCDLLVQLVHSTSRIHCRPHLPLFSASLSNQHDVLTLSNRSRFTHQSGIRNLPDDPRYKLFALLGLHPSHTIRNRQACHFSRQIWLPRSFLGFRRYLIHQNNMVDGPQ
jgi:hypothetical protein